MAHIPVLLQEILHHLSPKDGGVYVDCTFGAGGYTRAILSAANCKVIAFDRDSNVQKFADSIAKDFPERFVFHNVENALIGEILENVAGTIDGIVYDLGVSSMQIDTAERGFSFQEDGPLDMRMDTLQTLTAEHIVNEFSETEIANIIYQFGDERKSRVIARAIIDYRQNQRITKTLELARIVQSVLKQGRSEINVATKTFQALRIYVNSELDQLKISLQSAKTLLKIGGRLVAVSFHSGEDKIVKSMFNSWCGKISNINKYLPQQDLNFVESQFTFLNKGTVIATNEEVMSNPRSRSARLRAIVKTS